MTATGNVLQQAEDAKFENASSPVRLVQTSHSPAKTPSVETSREQKSCSGSETAVETRSLVAREVSLSQQALPPFEQQRASSNAEKPVESGEFVLNCTDLSPVESQLVLSASTLLPPPSQSPPHGTRCVQQRPARSSDYFAYPFRQHFLSGALCTRSLKVRCCSEIDHGGSIRAAQTGTSVAQSPFLYSSHALASSSQMKGPTAFVNNAVKPTAVRHVQPDVFVELLVVGK